MGGGKRRNRTQRKHFKQNRDNVWKRSKPDDSSGAWEPFATQNPSFDEYYKEQGVVPPERWNDFMGFLRKPLPAAFRINSCTQFFKDIRSQLENDFMGFLKAEAIEGGDIEAIRPLPWYPENLAWHSNFSRMQLRKNQSLSRFHDFLKLENEIGNITRQEAVSMVPPLFLDVHPNHYVLDMCAAPGSKTFQLLEIIHQSTAPGSLPPGLVVANDVDAQRCNLLIHQTKRMGTSNLIVTNNEAHHFPGCRINKVYSSAFEMGCVKEQSMRQLLFDRVLCDVPCSGDGTLRKAPDIWRKWNAGMGNGVHFLQVQIALRGASLLKVGGRMVYSTCSMNPVENEAVVAELLLKCGGSLELVDVSCELPHLVRHSGLKKWKVRDKGIWLSSYKDVPNIRRGGILPSMFPSGKSYVGLTNSIIEGDSCNIPSLTSASVVNEEGVSSFPLERCVRIMPHDQNTGAFFVAVFHKLSPLPAIPKESIQREGNTVVEDDLLLCENTSENTMNLEKGNDDDDDDGIMEDKRKIQRQGKWKGVDPVVYFRDVGVINSIKSFYGIDDSFGLNGHLVTRNNDSSRVKRIYYVSKCVKDVLDLNFCVNQQLKITSVGLKMFERATSKDGSTTESCTFRISSEGLPLLLPYITKQILFASLVDFKHLLQYKTIKFGDFVNAEFGEKVSNLLLGCCVIVLTSDGSKEVSGARNIAIGCWKGRGSLTVMVTELDCLELLQRLPMPTTQTSNK